MLLQTSKKLQRVTNKQDILSGHKTEGENRQLTPLEEKEGIELKGTQSSRNKKDGSIGKEKEKKRRSIIVFVNDTPYLRFLQLR